MFYPTFFSSETKTRHVVKDRYCYECGQRFNLNYELKKKDLKNIKFKSAEEITCPKCKTAVNKALHIIY